MPTVTAADWRTSRVNAPKPLTGEVSVFPICSVSWLDFAAIAITRPENAAAAYEVVLGFFATS